VPHSYIYERERERERETERQYHMTYIEPPSNQSVQRRLTNVSKKYLKPLLNNHLQTPISNKAKD
jgi:hypothetical protein